MYLQTRQIEIDEQSLKHLQQDVWREQFVPGYLVHPDGREKVNIRYRGGHTRNYPKKSFEIQRTQDTVHLNAMYDDPSMIRDALSFQFFKWIGVPSPNSQHCTLVLNGSNLGVYLALESVNPSFFRRRNIPCRTLMYAANDDANFSLLNPDTQKFKASLFDGYELVIGNTSDIQKFKQFILQLNTLTSRKLSKYLQESVDVPHYLRWLAGAVCTGNYDGFNQNYAIYQHATTGMYRIIPWDYEGTWGRNCFGEPCSSDAVRITGYNILTKKLFEDKSVVRKYADMLQEIIQSSFTLQHLDPVIESTMSMIREDVYADPMKKRTNSQFDAERDIIRAYIKERRYILQQDISALR